MPNISNSKFDLEKLTVEGTVPQSGYGSAGKECQEQHRKAVAAYVAAGGESVQRVITGIYGVTKKLDQWYVRQLADLDLTQGEWAVVAALAKAGEARLAQPARRTSPASRRPR